MNPLVTAAVCLRLCWGLLWSREKPCTSTSSLSAFSATSSVEPSCTSTASHRGMMPAMVGTVAATTLTSARMRLWLTTLLVSSAILNSQGRLVTPFPFSTMMSAAAATMSEGVVAIAMPTLAAASAGASLIPSPTMTSPPVCFRPCCTNASLPSGLSAAW